MRIITDIFDYCTAEVPKWNTISISGYHIREAGSSAVQELAFTLANGKAYVEAAMAVGLDPNAFGKRLSFFFNAHNNFFQEVAKFRAARRMWASIMAELGATEPEAQKLRFHTQTGGSTLTAQQPENNIVRVAIQAFSAVCGGTQSLHTNGFDEAISLPTENAARTALRTQQIIAAESGAADTVDPFAGSYFIEAMTDELEARALELMKQIDAMGGAVSAIEQGFMQDEIARASYTYQKGIEDGSVQIVGVNTHQANDTVKPEIFKVDNSIGLNQARKLGQLRSERNADATKAALQAIRERCSSGENLMPSIVTACEAYATLGEIADVLRAEFGEFAG
jgi:methylmalonyl-CoA mutase N-terminal domain/subunit